jgi:type IV secretion system protein VirD4
MSQEAIIMSDAVGRLVIKLVLGLILSVIAWTVVASLVFLIGTDLLIDFRHPFYQWWLYAFNFDGSARVALWLKISAGAAVIPPLLMIAAIIARGRRVVGPRLRRPLFGGFVPSPLAVTDNHGHARWMDGERVRRRFPGPDKDYGGVVVGEDYRVDLSRVAHLPFEPHDPTTWGPGGKAPLLIDPCHIGPTHSMLITGSGGYKTATAVATLLHWFGSAVILDAAGALSPMLTEARLRMGHAVYNLEPGGDTGFNVLDWIDPASPAFDTNVDLVVSWICGEKLATAKADDFFEESARSVLAALISHTICDPEVPPRHKTLATVRTFISTPGPLLRQALQAIYENSPSPYARQLAGPIFGLVEETFSGVMGNLAKQTRWLANDAFGKLVSGASFSTKDLMGGKATVFIKMPLKVLDTTPGVSRAIIGALLNAAYEADGNLKGRVLYLLDEVARLGRMSILEVARDAGRKYGITMQLLYQSTGQIIEQWGPEGKKAWYDGVSWRAYAAVQDPDTARELEEIFGTFGVMASSEGTNTGISAKALEAGSRSRGSNVSYHEIGRPLLRKAEIMQDVRTDELFVVSQSAPPLRCGRAIFFRRDEMVAQVATNRFYKKPAA